MSENQTPKEAYLEGRLLGLNRLITILKEAMKEDQTTDIDQILVGHIANEMNTILDEMQIHHGDDHPIIMEAKKKVEQLPTPTTKQEPEEKKEESKVEEKEEAPVETPSELKKSVDSADELMQSLMSLKKEKEQKGE